MSQPPRTPGSSPSKGSGADMAKGMSQASRGLSVAFGFVFVVVVFWFAGKWIDDQFGSDPWAQIAGALIGWVLGVVTVVYMAKNQQD